MTQKISVVALLSIATVTGAVLLAAVNPVEAFPSPFKSKSVSENVTGESSSLVFQTTKLKKMVIASAGIATLAGLTAAGVAFKANRIKTSLRVLANNSKFCGNATFPLSVTEEMISSSTTSQNTNSRDLTSVG